MLWLVCVLIACQTLVSLCMFALAAKLLSRERDRLKESAMEAIREWITAPDADTPSPLAALIDTGATLLAARLVQNVKAMLAGVESGSAKGEQLALIDDAMASSPWLGLIGGMLPKRLRNALMRNPQMVAALSKIGSNHSGGATNDVPLRRHRD